MQNSVDKRLLKVWQKYCINKEIDNVIRAGYVACGTGKIQPQTTAERARRNELIAKHEEALSELGVVRAETDGGHIYGTILLADLLHRFFPEFIDAEIHVLIMSALLYHEIDERENGDQLDDGTQDLSQKATDFENILEQELGDVPHFCREKQALILSERMNGTPFKSVDRRDKIVLAAWCIKAIDKLEAVLKNAIDGSKGIVGHISQKKDPSSRDMKTVNFLGTDDITFVWALPLKEFFEGTILWRLILVAVNDAYPVSEIPAPFRIVPD